MRLSEFAVACDNGSERLFRGREVTRAHIDATKITQVRNIVGLQCARLLERGGSFTRVTELETDARKRVPDFCLRRVPGDKFAVIGAGFSKRAALLGRCGKREPALKRRRSLRGALDGSARRR